MTDMEIIAKRIKAKNIKFKACTECGNVTWDIEIIEMAKLPIMSAKENVECISFTCKNCGYVKLYNMNKIME
ncbi:hypothetical protein SPSIL_057330 [Sporomusa silvacetica DSM 10669]|uniref:Uncharacterized protein n=1 Tax=Sporomusa silvacetica DSM 10669 TaxID=1123289 RepID=A0ABZ3IUY7_9FIRM|nr:hypothetical protein [Sporomusa silvacetica]OZC15172.1 hypothetical protein SPSIL_42460 [Sporomusa silvacetica DSM 10669]